MTPYDLYMQRVKEAGLFANMAGHITGAAGKIAPMAQQAGEALKTHGAQIASTVGAAMPGVGAKLERGAELYQKFKPIVQDIHTNAPRLAGKPPVAPPTPATPMHHALGYAALGAGGMYVGNELAKGN